MVSHTYLQSIYIIYISDDPSSAQMVEGKEAARDSALGLSLVTETPQGVTQELTAGVWIPLWIKSTIKGNTDKYASKRLSGRSSNPLYFS